MANHNCTVNIALGPGTTSPGPYTVQVKKCNEINYTIVPGSPFPLSSFPISFNVCTLLGISEGSCFEWQVIDTVTGCVCGGDIIIPVEPTPSITPTATISATPGLTVTESPTLTPTISTTPTITPTISTTPTITPTISVTPTITPTISVTPSVFSCGFTCTVTCSTGEETGNILYLSGLTTHVVYSTWSNTRFLNENGQTQIGAEGLFNEGDFIEGTVYTQYYGSLGSPEVINGNRIPLKDNQFLVISQQEFENHWFTKYCESYLQSSSNQFLKIPRYDAFIQPINYEVYDFNVIPNPGPQPQLTYNGEFKLLIVATQNVINNFDNDYIISVLTNYAERWVEWMESIGVNATYDISLPNANTIWDNVDFGAGGPTAVHNYYYGLGGLTNETGYDASVGIYLGTGGLNGIASPGLRVSQTRFPNNNSSLEYFRTTFIHEIGHSIGLAHSFQCNTYTHYYESIGIDVPALDGVNRQYYDTNSSGAGSCVNVYNGFVQPYSGDTDGNASAMSYKERQGYFHTQILGMARQLDINRIPTQWYNNCSFGFEYTRFGISNLYNDETQIIYNKFTEGNEFDNSVTSVTIELSASNPNPNLNGDLEIYLTDVNNNYLVDTINLNGQYFNYSQTVQLSDIGNIWNLNNQENFGVKLKKGNNYYVNIQNQTLKITFNSNSSNIEKQPAGMLTEKTPGNWGLEIDYNKNDCAQYATLGEAEVQKQYNRIFYNVLNL